MSTALATQLSQIAANSESSLNLKAQKAKHSKSLIFEPRIAASQSFDTVYTLCHGGFQELCLLDGRFVDFQRDIFSEQSPDKDRTQMTAAENGELNKRLESFLGLVGGKLRLNPGIKAVEWLVRRFRLVFQRSTIRTFANSIPEFTSITPYSFFSLSYHTTHSRSLKLYYQSCRMKYPKNASFLDPTSDP